MNKMRFRDLWKQLKKRKTVGVAPEDHPDSIPSIAVLPFQDLSENGDQAYFCEGLAEEILDSLRKVPNLRVASRVAAFQLDVQKADFDEVG